MSYVYVHEPVIVCFRLLYVNGWPSRYKYWSKAVTIIVRTWWSNNSSHDFKNKGPIDFYWKMFNIGIALLCYHSKDICWKLIHVNHRELTVHPCHEIQRPFVVGFLTRPRWMRPKNYTVSFWKNPKKLRVPISIEYLIHEYQYQTIFK